MDQQGASQSNDQATPIFGAYRRGYDPEQVDRYVADQQRRLDEMTVRASEAERRLAAAVGQLRELHRRVAVLESEERPPQAPALDTLGERVQRILQEAWEGAYALRQGAEQEVGELRAQATEEAERIVEDARAKARAIEEASERRRKVFVARMDEDRNRALAQISYLHDQRRVALEDLVKVKEVIEATVGEAGRAAREHFGEPGTGDASGVVKEPEGFAFDPDAGDAPVVVGEPPGLGPGRGASEVLAMVDEPADLASGGGEDALVDDRPTVPVAYPGTAEESQPGGSRGPEASSGGRRSHPGVFDFEVEQP